MKQTLLLAAAILFLGGCNTLSSGKSMVKKNETAIEVAVGMNSSPNIGIGVKYGISDKLNINMNVISPIMASENIIILEPSLVTNIIEDKGFVPKVNCYVSLPALISLKQPDFRIYPVVGIVPKYEGKDFGGYMVFETLAEYKNSAKKIDFKLNIRTGLEYKITEKWTLNVEAGVNNIGYKNALSDAGYPALFLGTTIKP